jgi:hypothetical protein
MEKKGLASTKSRHFILSQGAVGPAIGAAYHEFCFDLKPVSWTELKTKKGLDRVRKMAAVENYRADLISVTNESICDAFKDKTIMDDKEIKVIVDYGCTISADQAAALLALLQSLPVRDSFRDLFKTHGNALVAHCGSRLGL